MTKNYFLLVKDVLSNTEYIFSDKSVTKKILAQAFSDCFEQLRLTRENLQMNSHEMYCECFETITCLTPGWVYNYTSEKTQVCYIIRAVEVMETNVETKSETCHHPYVQEYLSEMVSELKIKLSQPKFGLK
jgi:hypothetical protein